MKPIPIPPCNNNRRTHMKCRRMCCKRPKPVRSITGIQTVFLWEFAKPSSEFDHWTNHADLTQVEESS